MANEPTRLVAVYDGENEARRAVHALEEAGLAARVRVADPADLVASLNGEMRAETARSYAGPGNVGPFTKEMAQGSLLGVIVGGAAGVLLALPFAAIPFGGMALWTRLLTVAVVGAVIGATIGWIVIGAFAARRPEEPLAAEAGVTVSVPTTVAARDALVATDARRIDVVRPDGSAVSTVAERSVGARHVVHDVSRHMRNESREG